MSKKSQLELPIRRERVPDRNFSRGGRSFYFFDLDDNVIHFDTRIYLVHRDGGPELALSTRRFAEVGHLLGRRGELERYSVVDDDERGSFRRFRGRQPFLDDLRATLRRPDVVWQGPSWPFFYHAVYNERPVAIITARGHEPSAIEDGLVHLYDTGHLHARPSLLGVYTVTHRDVRAALGDPDGRRSVPELKRAAILAAVEQAMRRFGENPHHRFGVSDDDPKNLALALEALEELKHRHPENAFFVIDASRRPVVKTEVLVRGTRVSEVPASEQLQLFD